MMGLLLPELVLPEATLDRDGLRDVAGAWAALAADDLTWADGLGWGDATPTKGDADTGATTASPEKMDARRSSAAGR